MKLACLASTLLLARLAGGAEQPGAATLSQGFQRISVDPEQSYRVRDLQFTRGDVKIYLNDGVLSFAAPVNGLIVAAIFTAEASDVGDAEILMLPAQRSERASLATFIKAPNLNEHFKSAVFLFSDGTAQELVSKIRVGTVKKAPEVVTRNAAIMNAALRMAVSQVDIRLVQASLDNHRESEGFFYGFIAGRELGDFDVLYEPSAGESIAVGRVIGTTAQSRFQLWTAFRPRHPVPQVEPLPVLSDYRIDATIRPDLSMAAVAKFICVTGASAGRVLAFELSDKLRVKSASVDGKPAEVFQPNILHFAAQGRSADVLLVSEAPLEPASPHSVEVRYEGSVIRQTGQGGFFVDERNVWYPYVSPMRTIFDLTFRFDSRLTLVSTGELLSDEVVEGQRMVHRRTHVPEGLAGFNLGDYKSSIDQRGRYRVECYAERAEAQSLETVAHQTEAALDYYTKEWNGLPIPSVAVTPIAGTFGQGFPGLIYLSTLAYMRPEDRPALLRNARSDTFFSEMLLPHEVAHQWWGNVVIPADYRSGWLVEAMANYSALGVLNDTQGPKAVEAVLASYRVDLLHQENGRPVESFGPVDFGVRLLDTAGVAVWHKIVYEKGTWILQMLNRRLGGDGFRRMQLRLLEEFASKPVSNEDFRRVASAFVPPGQPDQSLELFFDAWIYGTGIPRLSLSHSEDGQALVVSGVDEDFTADLPLVCRTGTGGEDLLWIRASSGSNVINSREPCALPPSSSLLYAP